jgi:hypothetical protein
MAHRKYFSKKKILKKRGTKWLKSKRTNENPT